MDSAAVVGGGGGAATEEAGTTSMRKKAEIDTSAPFRSVHEAVLLFGEKILGGQIYANKLIKEMQDDEGSVDNINHQDSNTSSDLGSITAELEETKQGLQRAKEDSLIMATCLASLQEELEKTKQDLQTLKKQQQMISSSTTTTAAAALDHYLEIEDVKFVEDHYYNKSKDEDQLRFSSLPPAKSTPTTRNVEPMKVEFQKKRYVTFADPPCLANQVDAVPPPPPTPTPTECDVDALLLLQRHPSLRKSKKKPLIPLIKGIFRKRGSSGVGPAAV